MTQMTTYDVAYFAGFFDGEGSITIHRCNRKHGKSPAYQVSVVICNTDVTVPLQAQEHFGGHIVRRMPRAARSQFQLQWTVKDNNALRFLSTLRPHLRMKGPQADVAIAFQKMKTGHRQMRLSAEELAWRETQRATITALNGRGDGKEVFAVEDASPVLTQAHLAYLAGFFDGEGSIHVDRKHVLHAAIGNTNPTVLAWAHGFFGGHLHRTKAPTNPKQKRASFWLLAAGDAGRFLSAIRPYLRMKGPQADLALELRSRANRWGRAGLPDAERTWRDQQREAITAMNARPLSPVRH